MFEINSKFQVRTSLPLIVEDYEEFLFDEVPILFSGLNEAGQRILGSSVDEDLQSQIERYFHVIVDTDEFERFRSQKMSLRSVYIETDPLYVVDKKGSNIYRIYQYSLKDVPAEYLPTEFSYFPVEDKKEDVESVFRGFRAYSPAKLVAMVEYILRTSSNIYKTNLIKLLFYSDLTSFYLMGKGMSGAVYVNRPYGPVPNEIDEVLIELITAGVIEKTSGGIHLLGRPLAVRTILDDDELKVLEWVLKTYGKMGAAELSDISHQERAYNETRPNEPIAYAFAQFLNRLPKRR